MQALNEMSPELRFQCFLPEPMAKLQVPSSGWTLPKLHGKRFVEKPRGEAAHDFLQFEEVSMFSIFSASQLLE